MSVKQERHVELVEARISRAMHAIRVIASFPYRSNYEYTDDDIRQIVKARTGEIDALQKRFRIADSRARPEFKLS